jgi:hypothetical protein
MLAHSARSTHPTHAIVAAPGTPQVSIVLVVSAMTPWPAARVSSAVSTCKEHGAELIVAWKGARAILRSLESAFPSVRFVTAESEDVDVRALRALASALATGDVVSIVPETQPLDESWFARRVGAKAGWREGDSA